MLLRCEFGHGSSGVAERGAPLLYFAECAFGEKVVEVIRVVVCAATIIETFRIDDILAMIDIETQKQTTACNRLDV